MLAWRFDQGRLNYFQVDEIKRIACALAEMQGMQKPIRDDEDFVRIKLKEFSELAFLPENYFVWRNYGRVFECMMLATSIDGKICATELCKKIADDPEEMDPDDYLAHFTKNFYYPSPIFDNYDPEGEQVFPAIAIIKFLISQYLTLGKNSITVDEVVAFLVLNDVTGLESLNEFSHLAGQKTPAHFDDRQIRELIKVISQFSFLKWADPYLYLEIHDENALRALDKNLYPVQNVRKNDGGREILQMGQVRPGIDFSTLTLQNLETNEDEFIEGQKIRVSHLRSERSVQLKKMYFQSVRDAEICDMCLIDTSKKYPWSPYVIELHHLLPLASAVRVEKGTTSIRDLVGLCPSCHSATHRYYSLWLKNNKAKDFVNREEAIAVYEEAKRSIGIV
jgi:hypothetical protein